MRRLPRALQRHPLALLLVAVMGAGCDSAVARDAPKPSGARSTEAALTHGGEQAPAASLFSSPSSCRAGLSKTAPRAAGKVRIGTWNLRWFPDGRPGKSKSATGTDLEWLACAIAGLRLDAVAVQEFKATAGAQAAAKTLVTRLNELTSGRWRVELDHCPSSGGQHVGLLFDEARAHATGLHTYGSVNPHGSACTKQLRPAFGAYLRFPGGLDLHLLSLHLKSGRSRRDYDLRTRSWEGLGQVLATARAVNPDADIVLAGDWNTMGCSRCKPSVSASAELGELSEALEQSGLNLLRSNLPCSQYHRQGGTLLDHLAASRAMAEVPAQTVAVVGGYCAEQQCQRLTGTAPAAYVRLSDHCPIVVELADRDLD